MTKKTRQQDKQTKVDKRNEPQKVHVVALSITFFLKKYTTLLLLIEGIF